MTKCQVKQTLYSYYSHHLFYYRGWQGLIAQGCHSSILIIDPKTAQTIQVLEKHKANVVKVSLHLFTNLFSVVGL